jgi:hypothetical protein
MTDVVAATFLAILALAADASSAGRSDPNTPAQQSECEIRSNAYRAKHPHSDMFEDLKHGVFFFGGSRPPNPPFLYRDANSGIAFHVESDGRHLVAFDADGKLLWTRNPFVDDNMCPYRSAHPIIGWIGSPSADFGFQHLDPSWTPAPDDAANKLILKELNSEIDAGRKAARPRSDDRFIGLTFDSSQQGYVNIRNGDFYFMGQN